MLHLFSVLTYGQKLARAREEARKKKKQEYYQRNKEKLKAYALAYYKVHPITDKQKELYKLRQRERYQTDDEYRAKVRFKNKQYKKRQKVKYIVSILDALIQHKTNESKEDIA